jgi:hypothetical protein
MDRRSTKSTTSSVFRRVVLVPVRVALAAQVSSEGVSSLDLLGPLSVASSLAALAHPQFSRPFSLLSSRLISSVVPLGTAVGLAWASGESESSAQA